MPGLRWSGRVIKNFFCFKRRLLNWFLDSRTYAEENTVNADYDALMAEAEEAKNEHRQEPLHPHDNNDNDNDKNNNTYFARLVKGSTTATTVVKHAFHFFLPVVNDSLS